MQLDAWQLDPGEEISMSRKFGVVHLAHDCRPIEDPELLFLEPLIMGLLKFVMRLESCFSIREKALEKALLILRRLNVYRDERMMIKAKRLTPGGFTKLLTERLAPQNSLCGRGGALVA